MRHYKKIFVLIIAMFVLIIGGVPGCAWKNFEERQAIVLDPE